MTVQNFLSSEDTMQLDKEIMDFVLAEDASDGQGTIKLVIDTNRRTDPRVQRWVMDMVKSYPNALKEFVSLSELNARREQQKENNTDVPDRKSTRLNSSHT